MNQQFSSEWSVRRWVAATVLFAAAAAVAPHLVSHRGAPRDERVSIAPAAGLPGAPPTTADGIRRRIAETESRVREQPGDIGAAVLLADALLRRARATNDSRPAGRAREVLNAVLREHPAQYDALRMLGAIDLSLHRFGDALDVARRARDFRPEDAWNYGVMGDALIELGEYEQAFEAFDVMASKRPGAAAYARVGYARELRGNLPGALEAMQLAAQATPPQDPEAQAWYAAQIGELYLRMGKFAEAGREYRRAAFIFPGYPHAAIGQGRVEAALGHRDRALAVYLEQITRTPTLDLAARIGDLYAGRGELEQAERYYQLAEDLAGPGVRSWRLCAIDCQWARCAFDCGVPACARSAFDCGPLPAAAAIGNQPLDQFRLRRLGQVVVEACVARSALVFVLAPSGQGHKYYFVAERVADAARRFVAVHQRHADVEKRDVRPELRRQVDGDGSIVRDAHLVAFDLQHHLHHLGCVGIVFGNQHPALLCRPGAALGVRRFLSRRCRRRRQADDEGAAAIRSGAVGLDCAAVELDEASGQRQADAQAAERAVAARQELREHIEDPRQHLRRNADAGVGDRNLGGGSRFAGPDRDPAAEPGVLHGVVQDVRDRLADPRRIGVRPERMIGQIDRDRLRPRIDERSRRFDGAVHDAPQVDAAGPQFDLVLRDPGHVEQIVCDPDQVLQLPFERRPRLFGQPRVVAGEPHHLDRGPDRRERVAQFVR